MSKLRDEILDRRHAAEDYLKEKRILWDNAEKLFHNQLNDSITEGTKSQVFDPKLSTLTLERGYRVMSQLPTGKVRGISKNDVGGSQLMNLILDKYVIPNANSQFDFLTKMRMVDIYSNIYGNFFTLTDWVVKKNGYIGPDVWLLNIRDVFPQVGAVSIEDSDYVIARTWKPLSYFESIAKDKGFKNVDKIIDKLTAKAGSKGVRESDDVSKREETQYPQASTAKKAGYYEVLTQFEGDRWADFCVDADLEFRDIDNPHENEELPIDCKHSIPLLDDFMGMGDFERGGTMQMTINSVWNMYLDAVKMSIFPPVLINKDNIASNSSIQWVPTAKWLVRNQIDNTAKTLQVSPQGIQQFNNTYQVANAAIQNLFGSSDTSISTDTDQTLGKTPQALKMQNQRENTRDNADRFYMEQYLKRVMKKMVNLVSKRQDKAITFRMFEDDMEMIRRSYPEIDEVYDEKSGKITIGKGKTKDVMYDYEMISGSTFAIDEKQQQENMSMLLQLYMQSQTPQGNVLVTQLEQEGFKFKFGELFKRIMTKSGMQDWDKILEEMTDEEKMELDLKTKAEQFQAAMDQNLNQVPEQPAQQPAQPAQQSQPFKP